MATAVEVGPGTSGPVAVLRTRGVPRVLVAALAGRVPNGAAAMALLLYARGTGRSIAVAGALAAAYTVGMAFGAPVLARLADRLRQLPVLAGSAVVSSLGFVLVATGAHRPLGLAVAGTLVAGAATPPLEACLRALWPDLVPPERVTAGYALDVASQELIFLTGPVIAVVAVTAGGPGAGLLVAAALQLAGTAVFALSPASVRWRGVPAPRHWAGPLRSGPLRTLLTAVCLVGFALGSLNVAVTPYAESVATRSWAGWLLAGNALGALCGGIAYSLRPLKEPRRGLPWLGAGLLGGYLLLLSVPPLAIMVLLLVVAGLFLSPLLTATFLLVDELAPAGTVTEAFAWVVTAMGFGAAAGSVIDGAVAESAGVRAAFAPAPIALFVSVVLLSLVTRSGRLPGVQQVDAR